MTYSSALFESPSEALAAAQTRKYASVCDRIGVAPGDHLLEIGCGWGGFAEYAARVRGARVTGLTISRAQHDFARARVFEAGLADRVEIVLRDYRDERGAYDGVASIEMFEAVGEKYWPAYFDAVRERLKPGGAGDDPGDHHRGRDVPDLPQDRRLHPEVHLPRRHAAEPGALSEQIERAGLTAARQPRVRRELLRDAAPLARAPSTPPGPRSPARLRRAVPADVVLYLTSCAAAFRTGTTDVAQVTMLRPA